MNLAWNLAAGESTWALFDTMSQRVNLSDPSSRPHQIDTWASILDHFSNLNSEKSIRKLVEIQIAPGSQYLVQY